MKKKLATYTIIFTFSFLVIMSARAQEILTKQEAIAMALENNYGIKIANNNLKVAKNNKSVLNSGFLPTVTGNAGATYNVDNTEAVFTNGEVRELTGANSNRFNASVNVNYVLFDGLGRLYNYKQLKEQYNLTELQARETIENTLLQLATVYFNVAQLTQNVSLQKQNLKISKNRLLRVTYQFDYGQATKLDMLNAEVDINNDSINLLNTRLQLANAKRDLNVVLGRNTSDSFEVDTIVTFHLTTQKEALIKNLNKNNTTLQQVEKNIAISDFQLKANKSGYLPTIGLNGSYGWNRNNNNAASFLTSSTNLGLSGGISLSWNIFNGGSTRTIVQNAKINRENQKLLKEQTVLEITTAFDNAWEDYQNKLYVYKTQEQNVTTNKNNFKRSEERYKLGQITSIEFRQAQVNLINALNARNSAKYQAKLAELQLYQLSGDILNIQF